MVVSTPETIQADIIFVVEGTAINGAYINDLKSNYIIPTLEYFSQGNIDEREYISENANIYGIVVYHGSDCLISPSSDTFGPYTSPSKFLNVFEKLELIGGKGESHANIGEGLATALHCFEELQQKRDANSTVQKHCILVCNSPPYMMPVLESQVYSGKTCEQLAGIIQEKGINLSILSPRKIPALFKLFEKSGGDLSSSQTKNYAKDPRHLVLLKGFNLKERPVSPPANVNVPQNQPTPANLPIPSLPSPLPMADTITNAPQQPQNIMNQVPINVPAPQQQTQNQVFRPQNPQDIAMFQGMPNQMTGQQQAMMSQMVGQPRPNAMSGPQFANQQMPSAAQLHNANVMARPPVRWQMAQMMPPQQRPFMPPGQQQNNATGSALIAQLTQPPSTMPAGGAFNQMNPGNQMSPQQQNLIRMQQHQLSQVQSASTAQQMVQSPQNIQQTGPTQQVPAQQQVAGPQTQMPGQPNPQPNQQGRERLTIWQGILEWIEKGKNPNDQPKVSKHVQCQVSAAVKDGEPELKADNWPPKLIMQLMPKQLIGSIGGTYLKNSKTVLFHPQQCPALDSLTKVMNSSFAGCVHFTSQNCEIKILILLYTAEKRAYLGFIPNDQGGFVDRLRKVIQEQKSNHAMQRQGQMGPGGAPQMNPNQPGQPINVQPGQMQGGTPPTSQSSNPQQGLMMSQTNTMAMGGGQLTQNVVTSTNQQNQPNMGVGGQINFDQGLQQQVGNQVMQNPNTGGMRSGQPMMGTSAQQAAFDHMARQQNLEKINQLKQTLEAAQQQEAQYKSQLELISHLKTQQIHEALQQAQQQELQYQMQMEGGQPGSIQQQRMMRPVQSNNPGLRHLLQQQPQYRPQLINAMPQMGGAGLRPQQMNQQMTGGGNQQFDDVSTFDFM